MQRVRVKAYWIGMKYKNGRYIKMLNEGTYWQYANEQVVTYDQAKIYVAPDNINVLLQDTDFAAAATIAEVADNERVILYANGLYKQILQPGKYILWNAFVNYTMVRIDLNKVYLPEGVDKAVLMKSEISRIVTVHTIEPYEKGILYINGQFDKVMESGVYYFIKNETPVLIQKVDMRLQQTDVNGQEILTKDKAVLRVNFYAQYRVTDIMKALVDNRDMNGQLYTILQLAIREYIGGYTLDELLEKKNEIAGLVLETIRNKATRMGVDITDCGIKDIILPGDMKDIMNQVLIAEKRAQANVITRREETAGTRSMLNTAKLMEENEMLFRLKEMEYVEKIAEKINGISVSGTGDLIGQLSKIFVPTKSGTNK
ncbi:MAG: slipin family protein [Chitinophagales bacterium]|nr:slipin family protein [Chitinophagales bacterium]